MSLKRIALELSVAEYSFTGIETRPKLSESDAIARGMEVSRKGLRAGNVERMKSPSFHSQAVPMPFRCRLWVRSGSAMSHQGAIDFKCAVVQTLRCHRKNMNRIRLARATSKE